MRHEEMGGSEKAMIDFIRIRDLARQEEKLRWAVERQTARATRTTTNITGMPRGGGSGNIQEDDIIKLAMLREEHKTAEAALKKERGRLKKAMRVVTDGLERSALSMRYMQGLKIGDIMETLNYSKSSVLRLLRSAEHRINRGESQGKVGTT